MRTEPKKYIKERSLLDRLFNIPPNEDIKADRPVLFKDKWFSFGEFFLMGMDWDFVMLDCCVVSFIIQVTVYEPDTTLWTKLLLGVLVAYTLDTLLFTLHGHIGSRNLAKKTLVDDTFLF